MAHYRHPQRHRSRRKIVWSEQFTVGPRLGARAGLPLTGKGANKTPPERAALGLPKTGCGAAVGAPCGAKSLMVCSAGGLTGKGKGPDCDYDFCGRADTP